MELLGTILLFLLVWFIIIPIVRVVLAGRKVYSQYKKAAEQASGQGGFNQPRHERKAGWATAGQRKKKIGRDVGEYVEFEEVSSTQPQGPHRTDEFSRSIPHESQIEDAEWEDVK